MKSLSLGLALFCACFLSGARVSASYEPEIAKECVLIARSDKAEFNLILVHDGTTLWSRPVYREVLESGEFGTKRLTLQSEKWLLVDGDEKTPTTLAAGPEDNGRNVNFEHCIPEETQLAVNGAVVALIHRATPETLCRPVSHALDTSGKTVAFPDVPNYAACVRKIAAEHPEATAVLYRSDTKECEYKIGAVRDHTDERYTSCDRTLAVKLPGIGLTAGSWKTASTMGVCLKERANYAYTVEEVAGKTSKPQECFERVSVHFPEATLASWDSSTYQCLAKSGNRLYYSTDSNTVFSCFQRSCIINPAHGSVDNTSSKKHIKLQNTSGWKECEQQVMGMHSDAVYSVYKESNHECWACFGGDMNSAAGYRRCPLRLMCPHPMSASVHSFAGDTQLADTESYEECARLVTAHNPATTYAVWGPGRTCYAKFGREIAADSSRTLCPLSIQQGAIVRNAPVALCPNPEVGSVHSHGGHYKLISTDNYEECAQQVTDLYPDATYAVWGPTSSDPTVSERECYAKLGVGVNSDSGYTRCPLKVMMCPNPEPGSVELTGGHHQVDNTDSYEECAQKVAWKFQYANYAVWGPPRDGPRECWAKLGDSTVEASGYLRCPLMKCGTVTTGSVHSAAGDAKLENTATLDECAQKVSGRYPKALYAVWGPHGDGPRECHAKHGTDIHGDSTRSLCTISTLRKTQPDNQREQWSKIVLGEFGNVVECAKHASRAYPHASAVMLDASGVCTLRLELEVSVHRVTTGESTALLDIVRRRGVLEDRSKTHIDMGNAATLDECALNVRDVHPDSNGVSYEKDTKACYAVLNMISVDSTSYIVNSKWQSAMLPAATVLPLDYSLPENINLELFYAQELTLAYCSEATCSLHENGIAQLVKQESLKREIDPLFKQLSAEYASFKVGYLEFADKPIFPFGQADRDWCYRFLNSMTPYNDAYKAWVGDHWKRTWGNHPSGRDYLENQLDAAIAAVMRGDFSTEQFDEEGKLNLRVLLMVTDKGFHINGDVGAGKCTGADGVCKDYVPSADQCQCAEYEYPSVDQAVDVLAAGKVNTLFYIGENSENVYDLYNSINIKLSVESPELSGVTVMPEDKAVVHEFSPSLFRSGLTALVGAQAKIWSDQSA